MTKLAVNELVMIVQKYKNGDTSYTEKDYIKAKNIISKLPSRLRNAYLEYAIQFSSYEENRAFFYGLSHETICELFKDNKLS